MDVPRVDAHAQLAASEGNQQLAKLLVSEGAVVNVKDRWRNTPFIDAVREGHTTVAKELLKRGALLDWDDVRTSGELCERVPATGLDPAARGRVRPRSMLRGRGCILIMMMMIP